MKRSNSPNQTFYYPCDILQNQKETTMTPKALFLDLDGTLLNDQREITPGNKTAIDRALAADHKVIIATGRPLISALAQAEELGLTEPGCYVIAFNGGMIYDMGTGSVVYSKSIDKSIVAQVFAEAKRRKIHLQTYDERLVLVEEYYDQDCVDRYCKKIGMEYQQIPSISNLKLDPCKMLAINYEDQEPLREFINWIHEHVGAHLVAFFSCKEFIEIIPQGLGKGNAIQRLAAILGIPMEDTIAAGDQENDLSMIRDAGLGCAMANAVPAVKAAADYITEHDNNHDGIKEIIEKFMV